MSSGAVVGIVFGSLVAAGVCAVLVLHQRRACLGPPRARKMAAPRATEMITVPNPMLAKKKTPTKKKALKKTRSMVFYKLLDESTGAYYYFNEAKNMTTWELPPGAVVADPKEETEAEEAADPGEQGDASLEEEAKSLQEILLLRDIRDGCALKSKTLKHELKHASHFKALNALGRAPDLFEGRVADVLRLAQAADVAAAGGGGGGGGRGGRARASATTDRTCANLLRACAQSPGDDKEAAAADIVVRLVGRAFRAAHGGAADVGGCVLSVGSAKTADAVVALVAAAARRGAHATWLAGQRADAATLVAAIGRSPAMRGTGGIIVAQALAAMARPERVPAAAASPRHAAGTVRERSVTDVSLA